MTSTTDLKPKVKKTRGYMMGQKMTPQQMELEIIRLSKTNKVSEMVSITGKNRRTIERYLEKAKKKGKILTTASGHVTLPESELAKREFEKLSRDDLCKKYPSVQKWIGKRTAEAKGDKKKLKRVRKQLGNLKVVLDTTRLNPHMLLSSGEDGTSYGGLENVMSKFSMAMVEQRVVYQTNQKQPDPENIAGSFREHLMACRNFATYSGVSLPKLPAEHILSGKKVGFGQYAHIKMSDTQINACVSELQKQYGENSYEVACFVFYYLTGTRNKSIYGVKTSTVETLPNGWITCRVYEPKTKTSWKKYIPDDNPHYEIIQNWIDSRQKQHKPFLFSEDGTISENAVAELRDKYKKIYEIIGITENYFFEHAIHCLRHVSAHYWLFLTKYNYAIVAKIVGWKDIQTLILCYGEISDNLIFESANFGAIA